MIKLIDLDVSFETLSDMKPELNVNDVSASSASYDGYDLTVDIDEDNVFEGSFESLPDDSYDPDDYIVIQRDKLERALAGYDDGPTEGHIMDCLDEVFDHVFDAIILVGSDENRPTVKLKTAVRQELKRNMSLALAGMELLPKEQPKVTEEVTEIKIEDLPTKSLDQHPTA
jgi:hypothetical protein